MTYLYKNISLVKEHLNDKNGDISCLNLVNIQHLNAFFYSVFLERKQPKTDL